MSKAFAKRFQELTGNPPLLWQVRLFNEFLRDPDSLPATLDLPTGLGKTMIMAIWLIAREHNFKLPRRLIYVVDRRTVVDQATDLAMRLQSHVEKDKLAISTLRGQLADNRDWSRDPTKPAIIIGTVDLIGSALLFSGYRSSYKRRPLEAGMLGQDSLLVLDEAHLSKPFDKLIKSIAQFQAGQGSPMKVIRMSATSASQDSNRFELKDSDFSDPIINQRFNAVKTLAIRTTDKVIDTIATAAGELATSHAGSRIVIFVKAPKEVDEIRRALIKKDKSWETKIAVLTGTMRGLERDELVDLKTPIQAHQHERRMMQRFLNPDNDASQGECFLIATSAGEVGFDLNADHLVGDAAPLDSWIQRLGRVNRRGNGDATVILIKEKEPADKTEFDRACIATSALLSDGMDVSPKALAEFKNSLAQEQINAASSPRLTMVELTDILLDAWSMTSIIQPMSGRPEVGPWLRGIADELPQTTVAWRAELDEPGFADLGVDDIEEWFDSHRILTHETLSVPTNFAAKQLIARWSSFDAAERVKLGKHLVVLDRAGIKTMLLAEFMKSLERDEKQAKKIYDTIRFADVILPAAFGGIERGFGLLDPAAPKKSENNKETDPQARDEDVRERSAGTDVADIAPGRIRLREVITTIEDGEPEKLVIGNGTMPSKRAAFRLDLESDDDRRSRIVSYVPRREIPEVGSQRQTLRKHVDAVRRTVDAMLKNLVLPDDVRTVITLAAQFAADFHDHGKNRELWQRTVGGEATFQGQDWLDKTLGKSGGAMKRDSRGYRHEFGSLREFTDAFRAGKLLDEAGSPISQDVFDLAMHLIATHHGRGRPHFFNGGFDPDCETRSDEIHTESIRRFAHLQRTYGWWHLAWLENLLRCADAFASAEVEDGESQDDDPKGGEQ